MHSSPSSPDLDSAAAVAAQTWEALRAALAEALGEDAGADYLVADVSRNRRWSHRRRRRDR